MGHLLFEQTGRRLQLEITGFVSVTEPVQLFVDAMTSPGRLKAQRQALETFDRFRQNAEVASEGNDSVGRRLDLILSALDGSSMGLSQREIAVALYGRNRVESDWGRGSDHLKSHVRRLILRGRWLMEGGYLSLLR